MDHILYDNITSSSEGRDWGVKVATGALQNRSDLKKNFHKYATLVLGNSNIPLSELSPAIGGIPDPERKGYLLCVNVALKDLVGRSSLAIVGFWFTSVTELQRISAEKEDYEEMARKVLASPHETIKEFTGKTRGRCQDEDIASNRPRPVLKEFDSGGKAADSSLNLIYSCLAKRPIAVLGATCWFNPKEWERLGFDLVYFHGITSDVAHALEKYYSTRKEEEKKQQPTDILSLQNILFPAIVFLLCCAAVYVFVISAGNIEKRQEKESSAQVETSSAPFKLEQIVTSPHPAKVPSFPQREKTVYPVPPNENKEPKKRNEYLIQVEELLDRLKKYEQSGDLVKNHVYQWVNRIDVLPECQKQRKELLHELDFPYWHRNVLSPDILYYFDGSEDELPDDIREKQVKKRLSEKLPREFCTGLRDAFAAEFSNQNSKLTLWCNTISKLSNISQK